MSNFENIDISVEFAGKKLQSPFIVSSGPLTYAAEGMIKAHEQGAGAVVTKTIRLERAINPVNHIAIMNKDSLFNCEKWADSDAEVWFTREIPMAKAAGAVVIASVGHTLPEAEALVKKAEDAGADFIDGRHGRRSAGFENCPDGDFACRNRPTQQFAGAAKPATSNEAIAMRTAAAANDGMAAKTTPTNGAGTACASTGVGKVAATGASP